MFDIFLCLNLWSTLTLGNLGSEGNDLGLMLKDVIKWQAVLEILILHCTSVNSSSSY